MNEILKKNGLFYGYIIGLFGILSQIIVYIMGGVSKENMFTSVAISIIFWISFVVIRVIQCNKTKKEMNNFISFKELFTTLTLSVTVGILISQIFTLIFLNFIDVEYGNTMNEFLNEQQLQSAKAMKGIFNYSNEDLKEMKNANNFSLLKILQGTAFSIVLSSIMNLILAAIFKSKQEDTY